MGEHVRWANLGEPIYAEKDLEIFRPAQEQSTLPVYYIKAWLPYAADTVFNSLFDARYRKQWDATNVKQLAVLERRKDGDVMYCTQSMRWPFADRDYVYHRRTKFFSPEHSFVVVCQAMHHNSAPQCNGLVRVETYGLRLCLRSTGTSSCDLYVEYEDDTNFSIPNYVINLLLATSVPSFMHELRAACTNYANYTKTLDDGGVATIPSQVVRRKSDEEAASSQLALSVASQISTTASSTASTGSGSSRSIFASKHHKLLRRRRDKHAHSEDADESTDSSHHSETSLRMRTLLKSKVSQRKQFKKAASASTLFTTKSSSSSSHEHSDDDFAIEFHKQKIGLHLETDVFSNKVLVAYCEKDSEAAKASVCIEPGFLVTSVNGLPVADMNFTQILHEIKTATRPITLGFTHPDKENSKLYRRFKEPKNVLKCFVARDEHDLVRALRPLNEDASMSAVLKTDFLAPAFSKKRLRTPLTTKHSRSNVSAGGSSGNNMVVVPEGYLVYEIDDCYVLDLTFAEIAHLLRRNSEPRVVTFKAALAVECHRADQEASRSALSKRLSGVFKWRSYSFDDPGTTSSSSSASPYASSSSRKRVDRPDFERPQGDEPVVLGHPQPHKQAVNPSQSPAEKTASSEPPQHDLKWGDASPGACLSDYSTVTITPKNLTWAWQHVHLLKADERIFSAALLIEKLEAFLMKDGNNCDAAKTILNAMHEEREFMNRIKERNKHGTQALREFNCEDDTDWQFGQTYFGVSTHWKPGEDGTVWLKLDGLVEGVDIFNTIAVIRETDLYNVWVPFCNHSQLLQQSGHVDVVAYMSIAFPLLQRDAIIKAFGINACYESRAILLLGQTEDESTLPGSVKVPKVKGWNADRMEMRGFRALIEPITRTKARVCIVANMDPKCPIPRSLLNFGIKKVAGLLLYLVRKEAEKIEQAQRDLSENEHLRRIESDPTQFYSWLGPLMEKWFDDQRCDLLPPPLPLSSGSGAGVAGKIGSVAEERSPGKQRSSNASEGGSSEMRPSRSRKLSRTIAFHRHQSQLKDEAAAAEVKESERLQQSRRRMLIDYLYDFGIWPYMLMFIFSQVTSETGFLHVCLLKFIFTCTCTWFGVPGAFSWQTRRLKRAQRELDPLRKRCVVLAGLLDVLNSWFLRVWANWLVCYLPMIVHQFVLLQQHQQRLQQHRDAGQRDCFDRTPLEVRESENFWLIGSAFLFATVVVAIQIVVNI